MLETVKLFKALADETRLRILHLLCHRELCVCQIVEVLEIGQSKISRHLAHLRNASLVADRREGLWIYYSLAQPSGTLHEQITAWLKRAVAEIPMGETDLEALDNLGECGDLCPDHAASKDGEQCAKAEAVGS